MHTEMHYFVTSQILPPVTDQSLGASCEATDAVCDGCYTKHQGLKLDLRSSRSQGSGSADAMPEGAFERRTKRYSVVVADG